MPLELQQRFKYCGVAFEGSGGNAAEIDGVVESGGMGFHTGGKF